MLLDGLIHIVVFSHVLSLHSIRLNKRLFLQVYKLLNKMYVVMVVADVLFSVVVVV